MIKSNLRQQAGSTLLESLVSIAIFSFALLGLLGMQGNAMRRMGEAKYRYDAAFLADELAGIMWSTRRTDRPTTVAFSLANFNCGTTCQSSTQPQLQAWLQKVEATLPGVSLSTGTKLPSIVLGNNAQTGQQITITLRWQAPGIQGGQAQAGQYQTQLYIN